MRGFYVVFYYYKRSFTPPKVIALRTGKMPSRIGGALAFTYSPRDIPGEARRAANWLWSGPDYIPPPIKVAGFAAYRIISPTLARLVWHKPVGKEHGVWSEWHGNPWRWEK